MEVVYPSTLSAEDLLKARWMLRSMKDLYKPGWVSSYSPDPCCDVHSQPCISYVALNSLQCVLKQGNLRGLMLEVVSM